MNKRGEDGKLYTEYGQEIAGKEVDVNGLIGTLQAMSGSTAAQQAADVIARFKRLLLPVYMGLAETAMVDGREAIGDDKFIFTFNGAGASDFTFVAEFRALMGDERNAFDEYFKQQ